MVGASLEERDRRWLNIRHELGRSGLHGLLVVSDGQLERSGSMRYVSDTGASLMWHYVLFPLEGEPIAINVRGGWIEDREGITILHVSGTNYEMGYQHGYLLKDEISISYRILIEFFDEYGWSQSDLLEKWNVLKNYIPGTYLCEIAGIVDGSGLFLDTIGIINIAHDVANLIFCSGAILWGSATIDGELIHMRSTDLSIFLKDPITDTYFQENQIFIVRDPIDGFASMYPTTPGDIGSYGGINENGIGIGETTCITSDSTIHGTTASLRMRMVLDSASNIDEAIEIMDSNRTCGWNLLISDGNLPEGFILEQTANHSYLSTWNDPIESKRPFWSIEKVVRRSNCFLSSECIKSERKYHNPSGLISIMQFLLRKSPYFSVWTHYKALSKGIENGWGYFDLESSINMFRGVYLGETDFLFNFLMKSHAYMPINQWAASPKTGDMLICFASEGKIASENPIQYFNLFELLNSGYPK